MNILIGILFFAVVINFVATIAVKNSLKLVVKDDICPEDIRSAEKNVSTAKAVFTINLMVDIVLLIIATCAV